MLNRIVIQGRLTRDPELRTTGSGVSVASFSLAVDRDRKGQDGARGVDFIDIVAWRGTADFVSRYFTRGRMAVVEGRLQLRDWTAQNGTKRRSAEVVAENIYFCGDKPAQEGRTGTAGMPPADGLGSSGALGPLEEDDGEEELPF